MKFLTNYRAGQGGHYGASLKATSWTEARRMARLRGLNETVLGIVVNKDRKCSDILKDAKSSALDRVHALAFLSLFALQSKAVNALDILDDEIGVLHQWIHYERDRLIKIEHKGHRKAFTARLNAVRDEALKRVRKIERAIPGYVE